MHKSLYELPLSRGWVAVNRYYALNHVYFEMDYHGHDEMEVMYAVHGACRVDVKTKEGDESVHLLKQGEYIFLDGGVVHRLAVERGTPCRVLNLEMGRIKDKGVFNLECFEKSSEALKRFMGNGDPVLQINDQGGNFHALIVALQRQLESEADQKEGQIEADLLLAQLFIEMARQGQAVSASEGRCRYVRHAMAYLKTHFEQEIRVEDVAEAVGVSTAHLQRMFKEETGGSIWDKLIEMRIEKAKLLLEISNLPVIDVAVSVGFQNRQHFSHTFNQHVGCPPGTYRKYKGNMKLWAGF